MKNILIILIIILLAGVGWWWFNREPVEVLEVEVPTALDYQDFIVEENIVEEQILGEKIEEEATSTEEIVEEVATSINLDIPFTSQAPTANWEQPFQDACEEASLLMVDYYYQNKEFSSPESVETILVEMVAWQEENWGGHFNLPTVEVADFSLTTFNYTTEVVENLTAEKIREYLRQGLPVILPADGHKLDNPYFSGDGPEYHMLVVKGFVGDKFITNDPGTKRGADFIYTETNLIESIADWNKKEAQTNGPRVGLVLHNN